MAKAISLFSGCGGDTVGMTTAEFKVVAYNEFNKAAIQSHELNFPDSVLLQDKSPDITKVPDSVFAPYKGSVDLVFAGFPCFVEGTKVLTDSGYKPIETVELSDKLMTHTGVFQSIVNLQRKTYNQSLYTIDLLYHPDNIICTPEHPFYVRERTRKWNTVTNKYDYTFKSPIWKNAKDLTKNDYFGMIVSTKSIIPEKVFEKRENTYKKTRIAIELNNPDMWFMMGYFVGDGWIEETTKSSGAPAHKIRFSINTDDEATILPRIQKILPITDKKCDTGKCKKYGCADMMWYNILKEFGKYAHGKIIPEWVQDAPNNLIEEFIAGYLAADGNTCKDGKTRITTVSNNLALGLQRLYLKLGQFASVSRQHRENTHIIEGRTVTQRDTFTVEVIHNKQRNPQSFIENGYAWFQAHSITSDSNSRTEPIWVYNFEVAVDNSYIVENTIVHNCQGFSRGGKRKVDDPRNQMYLQFVRVVKLVKPKFFIGENVTGLTSMKSGPADTDPLILDKIKKAFQEIGYEITHQIVEATDFGVPQKRKRIILVGWQPSLMEFDTSSFWADVSTHFKGKMKKMRGFVTPSMEGAFEIPAANVPEDFAAYALPVPQNAVPTGTPHPYVILKASASNEEYGGVTYKNLLTCSKRGSPIHSEIIDLDKPCKTIICTYDHQPRLLVGLRKPDGTAYCRVLLPDELKQIQGFPADYKIHGNTKEQVTQIGNAVPPPIIEAVAAALKLRMN